MQKKYFYAGLVAGAGALAATSAQAQTPYTAGDLVVYRVDNNGAVLTNAGANVFLDEYTPAGGAAVFSQALTTTNAATSVVASGTATSEGELNLSTDGTTLFATGYNAVFGTTNTGATSIAGTTSATVARAVESVSGTQAATLTTINNYSANNIRSATGLSATSPIYTSGANTGILSVTAGSVNTTGTLVSSTIPNARSISISGGNLYFSTGSGTTRIDSLGSATAPSATATGLSPTGGGASPYSFVFATLSATATSPDTLYVADSAAGIQKYTLTGGTFTLTSTTAFVGVTGLIGTTLNGVETLYASAPGSIDSLVDASGAGVAVVAPLATIATAPTNDAFRGISFAPSVAAVPEPSSFAALVLGALGLGAVLRFRSKTARA